ncbi:hypothetical protein [Streptomyces sp. NPDC059460]|uniref:hypothetical protein n=1 Tax=Streptomyces sp. NPDC059460 TaxID=3346840 RepID=UPI0036A8F8B8
MIVSQFSPKTCRRWHRLDLRLYDSFNPSVDAAGDLSHSVPVAAYLVRDLSPSS